MCGSSSGLLVVFRCRLFEVSVVILVLVSMRFCLLCVVVLVIRLVGWLGFLLWKIFWFGVVVFCSLYR